MKNETLDELETELDEIETELDEIEIELDKMVGIKYLNYQDMKENYEKIFKKNYKLLKYITNIKLKDIKLLKATETNYLKIVNNLDKELEFSIAVVSSYKKNINEFINLKKDFEKNFFYGKYNKAQKILNLIFKNCGYSYWYFENMINFLEISKGNKAQKDYTKQIIGNTDNGFFIRFILFYHSYKVSMKNKEEFEKLLSSFEDESEDVWIKDYVKYRFDYFNNYKEYPGKDVCVSMDLKMSIYDGYERIIKIIQEIISSEKEINKSSYQVIERFYQEFKNINDSRVQKIGEFLNEKITVIDNEVLMCFDLYEKGEYLKCKNQCEKLFFNGTTNIEIFEIYITSCIKEKLDFNILEDSIIGKIFNLIRNLKLLREEPKIILDELKYYENIFSNSSIGYWIRYTKDFICKGYYLDKEDVRLYQLNTNNYDIKNLKNIFFTNDIYYFLENSNKNSSAFNLLEAFYNKDILKIKKLSIPDERKNRYIFEIYFQNEEYEKALFIETQIVDLDNLSFNSILKYYIECYLKIENMEKVLELVVDKYIKNKKTHIFLPLKEALNKIENMLENDEISEKIKKMIEYPILYTIYSKEIHALDPSDKFGPYEDFLNFYKVKIPSELIDKKIKKDIILKDISEEKLNYYLENVCTIPVMEVSRDITGKAQVIEERLKICKYLIENNKSSKVMSEVINLNKQKLVRKGVLKLNQNKINLDISEIKNIIINNLKDRFDKYKLGLFSSSDDLVSEYLDTPPLKFFEEEKNGDKPIESLSTEKYFYFESMKVFLFDKEFGIDTCLSMRIRHGILKNTIRDIFNDLKLITKKGEDGEYLVNINWLTPELRTDKERKVHKILSEKSRKIDELSNRIIKEFLQITLNDEEEKLFKFGNSFEKKVNIEEKIKVMQDIEEFAEFMIAELLEHTKHNLLIIQNYFQNEVSNEFLKILDDSSNKIKEIKCSEFAALKDKIISGKQSIKSEILKIKNWFSLKNKNDIEDYNIEYVKDLILEFFNCKIISEINVKSKLKGETLEEFFYILYNLIDNVIVHASDYSPECKLELSETKDNIIIKISNKIYKDISTVEKKILEIKQGLQNQDNLKISVEGGTGFYKIKSSLNTKLKVHNTMNIEINEDCRFCVSIILDKRGVVYENFNS